MRLARILIALVLVIPFVAVGARADVETVRMGVFVTSIANVSPAAGQSDIAGYLWMVTQSSRFAPETDLEVLARTSSMSPMSTKDLPNGGRYHAHQFDASIDHVFDLRDFPFDHQTLRLSFETTWPSDALRLVPDADAATLADFAAMNAWDVTDLRLTARTVDYATGFGRDSRDDFSRLTLEIDIERKRSVLVIESFIGYTVALLIAGLVYFVPADQIGVRVGMVTSAIFATVGNRYSLDGMLGAETSFGLVDQLSLIVFASIYTALVTSLLVYRLHTRRTASLAARVDQGAGVVAISTSFGLAALAILHARG